MRVKRGVTAHARHKKLRQAVKGMGKARRASSRQAKQAVIKALSYSYRDRRTKKRDFRSLWIVRINAGLEGTGISYSRFIDMLKKSNVEIDRKILSELAVSEPTAFKSVVETVSKKTK